MRVKAILLALVVAFLTACGIPENASEIEEPSITSTIPPPMYEHETEYHSEIPDKIAVITRDNNSYLNSDWLTELVKRHGSENVIIYTRPRRESEEEIAKFVDEIAQNTEIKVIIVNPGSYGEDYITDTLREQRNDVFIIYTDDRSSNDKKANLVLEVDVNEIVKNFPEKALELGADTLIFFYDLSVGYTEESDWHRMMREKSKEIGLLFVEVDVGGVIQCGSSYAEYMSETIPPLLEEYGANTVLFGLDNERLFWSGGHDRYIYLPIYMSWFEPTPFDIALRLSIIGWSDSDFHEKASDIPYLIEEIKNYLEENNSIGRIAFFPMSQKVLFPLAAAEYGLKWATGEVPQYGIDIAVLEQIMLDIITEYTGLQSSVNLTTLIENDVIYENYILVLPDYLIYQ